MNADQCGSGTTTLVQLCIKCRDADDAVYEMHGKDLLGARVTVEHAKVRIFTGCGACIRLYRKGGGLLAV